MNNKPRIVFMGTPEFAVAHLKKLIDNNYHVVGVVTAVDKPAGRGKKIKESAVKKYATSIGLPVLQPKNLKSEDFLQQLKNLQPDLQIVVAFRMLPKSVWSLPPMGTFNLHASLLPDYRGAAPIHWTIINGEKETGVTTFFIDEKIDTGAIILQEKVPVFSDDNAGNLHDRLMEKGSELVLKTVDLIVKGKVVTTPQPNVDLPKKAPKLKPENTRINWSQPAEKIHNFIRGLSPHPGAWTELILNDGQVRKFFIYQSHFDTNKTEAKPGTIYAEKKIMKIAAADGHIYPEIVKLQGKKQMNIVSFLNGIKNKNKIKISTDT